MCTKLRMVAASKNRDHAPQSLLLLLARATYTMVLFFMHIPFVVNHTINATPPERLQQYHNCMIDCLLLMPHCLYSWEWKKGVQNWIKTVELSTIPIVCFISSYFKFLCHIMIHFTFCGAEALSNNMLIFNIHNQWCIHHCILDDCIFTYTYCFLLYKISRLSVHIKFHYWVCIELWEINFPSRKLANRFDCIVFVETNYYWFHVWNFCILN